ncbi:MAG: non-heme iron oxygenase ferredoxin subunit [Nitriliruptorales bacterium]|nr:non-heme iron oxygenase ferredoxin subunit [Nitriliruptorales bacterium]
MALEKAAELSALTDNTPFKTEVEGVPVTLVKIGEQVYAVHDTCSHQDYSLSEGIVWDTQIECALHGSMFDLTDGTPESLPATRPVPVFPVEIDGDQVLVDVQNPSNDAPFPNH